MKIRKVTDKGQKQLGACIATAKKISEEKFKKCDCGTATITAADSEAGGGSLVGTKLVDVPCPMNVIGCIHGQFTWTCMVEVTEYTFRFVNGRPVPTSVRYKHMHMVAFTVTIDFYKISGVPVLWPQHAFLAGGEMGTRMFGNGDHGPVCICSPGGCACKPGVWALTVAANRLGFGTDVFDRSAVAAFWLDPILKHFATPSSPDLTEEESLVEVEESVEPGQSLGLDRHTMRPFLS